MHETDFVVGASDQRANDGREQQPRVDREQNGGQQTEPRGVGRGRLVHRFAILTIFGVMLTSLVAWTALLVYTATWAIGLF